MAAQIANRTLRFEKWTYRDFILTAGQVAFKNALAVIDTTAATGTLLAGAEGPSMVLFGLFDEHVDASLGAKRVRVNFMTERTVVWFKNDTTSPVAATQRGATCFLLDDQTVSSDQAGRSAAGMVLDVDPIKGVAIDWDRGRS